MLNFFKKRKALGVGLGVGLAGALALAVRHRRSRPEHIPIPESISPSIFATRVAVTSQGEIIFHTSGSGTPLVFLHGIYPGASSFEWSKVYPHFALSYKVLAPDLVGFGESERPKLGLDADAQVRALYDFLLQTTNYRPATIVASGFGTALALKLAVQHPEGVSRLILFGPAAFDVSMRRIPSEFSLLTRVPGLGGFLYQNYFASKAFLRGWLSRFGYADGSLVTEDVVDVLATCAGQYGAGRAILAFVRGRFGYDVRDLLTRLVQPVDILWPDEPERFPEDALDRIVSSIDQASVRHLPRLGPLGALENPDAVRTALESALDFTAVDAESA